MATTPAPADSTTRGDLLQWLDALRARARSLPLDGTIFALSLLLFAATRLIGLERFPIYFFTDEAIQALQAAELVQHGFHDSHGRLLPTYFQNGQYWNLSISVYAQVIPYELFGYSIVATRATSALIALTASAAVSLTLRDVFRLRAWWLAGLFLTVTPAWFLHSRTAFETVIATAMYAWFLYFSLRYITRQDRGLYAAVVFAALAFYSYASIQIVVVATALALALSNAPLHIREWRTTWKAAVLVAVVALPYLRFQVDQGGEVYHHLRTLDSYWVRPGLSFGDRLSRFWAEYRVGLSPSYWYSADNGRDLVRHVMKGYGHVMLVTAPFMLLGLAHCGARIRSAPHRALLLSLVLAPLGATVVGVQVTRALVVVVPLALLSGVGGALILQRLARRPQYGVAAAASLGAFAIVGALMLTDALRDGATWYDDYDLGGLQYGARQLRGEIRDYLEEAPEGRVILSPAWANGTNEVMRFLLPGETRLHLRNIDAYVFEKRPVEPADLFIMTPREYERGSADPRFEFDLVKVLPYPNGAPGFFLVRLSYSPQADAIFAAEAEARRQPITQQITIAGVPAEVTHSRLDIGRLVDVFDGDTFTLGRTIEANPAVFDVRFDEPRQFNAIRVSTGTLRLELRVEVFADEGQPPLVFTLERPREVDPTVMLDLPGAPAARRYRVTVRDLDLPADNAHVHVREIAFE